MTSPSGQLLRRSIIGALMATAAWAVQAQGAWPAKPLRIVVGFAPGGTTDVMARLLAQNLTEALGQTVLVENKPGASGNLAAGDVVKATPDGYTLLVAPTSVETANPSLFKASFLPAKDLTAVADFLGDKPFMLGDAPCTLDATAHAFLANVLWAPVDSPIRRLAQARPTLDAYCRRMQARCF